MKDENTKQQKVRLLFICYGNTCRSPMAEGIAREIFGESAKVASAGIVPYGGGIVHETVYVMQSVYNIDVSGHQPKSLTNASLDGFDYIIAMDNYVFSEMIGKYPDLGNKIIKWDIIDPFSQEISVYMECAEDIEKHVKELFTKLTSDSTSSRNRSE